MPRYSPYQATGELKSKFSRKAGDVTGLRKQKAPLVTSAVMRKNPKTIKIAILASIKSNTCNCGFSRKGIFSHDPRLCGESYDSDAARL